MPVGSAGLPHSGCQTGAVECSAWLGLVAVLSKVVLHISYRVKRRILWLRLKRVQIPLQCRILRLEFRMALNKTRMVCLKRGYYTGNEADLRSNIFFARVAVHHPVEVVKVFLDCLHLVRIGCVGLFETSEDVRREA